MATLLQEHEAVKEKLSKEADVAASLEEYKKRAQLALKKANASSAQQTAEIEQLRKAAEDAAARLQDAEALVEELRRAVDGESLRQSALQAEARRSRADFESENEKLRVQLMAKEAALEELRLAIAQLEREIERKDIYLQKELAVLQAKNDALAAAASSGDMNSSFRFGKSGCNADGTPDRNVDEKRNSVEQSPLVGDNNSSMIDFLNGTPKREGVHPNNQGQSSYENIEIDGTIFTLKPPLSNQLILVSELNSQLDELRQELASRGNKLATASSELDEQRQESRRLAGRVEELLAFMGRSKQLQEGSDSAVNMEYLKNCVYKFMATNDFSEKKRLSNVICTILKLTANERERVQDAIGSSQSPDEVMNSLGAIAQSWWTAT